MSEKKRCENCKYFETAKKRVVDNHRLCPVIRAWVMGRMQLCKKHQPQEEQDG